MHMLDSERPLSSAAEPQRMQASNGSQPTHLPSAVRKVASTGRLPAGEVLGRWSVRVADRDGQPGPNGARTARRGHPERGRRDHREPRDVHSG